MPRDRSTGRLVAAVTHKTQNEISYARELANAGSRVSILIKSFTGACRGNRILLRDHDVDQLGLAPGNALTELRV